MTKAFASVEWLSQSSCTSTRTTTLDSETPSYSWTYDLAQVSKAAEFSPVSWDEEPQYVTGNDFSPNQRDTNVSRDSHAPIYPNSAEMPSFHKENSTLQSPSGNKLPGMETFIPILQKMTKGPSADHEAKDPISSPTGEKTLPHAEHTGRANVDSGYDSETGRFSSTCSEAETNEEFPDTSDEESKTGRRLRTAFTTEQICTLEKTFKKHKYLGASERRKLAAKLQLSEVQIKTWFQNRRMKLKREMQELRPEPYHAAPFYNMYPYPQQHNPVYQYPYPPQQPYANIPLMEPMPPHMPYPVIPPSMDTMNPFTHPAMPMMYMPHHIGYHEERPFLRY